MSQWPSAELHAIIEADDLHIAPLRGDSATYGTPTWVWCVQVDGALYARAYHGQGSRWYRAAVSQRAGRIVAAGKTTDVQFEPVAGQLNDRIDEAYRAKYGSSPYLAPMVAETARSATVRITPNGRHR